MQIIVRLAECVALWGEPEQAVHGIKERAAISSGMKGIRETIWLVIAFELRTYGAGNISLARLPQQLLKQHALLSLMFWTYSTCAVFGLLLQQCRALSRSGFYVSL